MTLRPLLTPLFKKAFTAGANPPLVNEPCTLQLCRFVTAELVHEFDECVQALLLEHLELPEQWIHLIIEWTAQLCPSCGCNRTIPLASNPLEIPSTESTILPPKHLRRPRIAAPKPLDADSAILNLAILKDIDSINHYFNQQTSVSSKNDVDGAETKILAATVSLFGHAIQSMASSVPKRQVVPKQLLYRSVRSGVELFSVALNTSGESTICKMTWEAKFKLPFPFMIDNVKWVEQHRHQLFPNDHEKTMAAVKRLHPFAGQAYPTDKESTILEWIHDQRDIQLGELQSLARASVICCTQHHLDQVAHVYAYSRRPENQPSEYDLLPKHITPTVSGNLAWLLTHMAQSAELQLVVHNEMQRSLCILRRQLYMVDMTVTVHRNGHSIKCPFSCVNNPLWLDSHRKQLFLQPAERTQCLLNDLHPYAGAAFDDQYEDVAQIYIVENRTKLDVVRKLAPIQVMLWMPAVSTLMHPFVKTVLSRCDAQAVATLAWLTTVCQIREIRLETIQKSLVMMDFDAYLNHCLNESWKDSNEALRMLYFDPWNQPSKLTKPRKTTKSLAAAKPLALPKSTKRPPKVAASPPTPLLTPPIDVDSDPMVVAMRKQRQDEMEQRLLLFEQLHKIEIVGLCGLSPCKTRPSRKVRDNEPRLLVQCKGASCHRLGCSIWYHASCWRTVSLRNKQWNHQCPCFTPDCTGLLDSITSFQDETRQSIHYLLKSKPVEPRLIANTVSAVDDLKSSSDVLEPILNNRLNETTTSFVALTITDDTKQSIKDAVDTKQLVTAIVDVTQPVQVAVDIPQPLEPAPPVGTTLLSVKLDKAVAFGQKQEKRRPPRKRKAKRKPTVVHLDVFRQAEIVTQSMYVPPIANHGGDINESVNRPTPSVDLSVPPPATAVVDVGQVSRDVLSVVDVKHSRSAADVKQATPVVDVKQATPVVDVKQATPVVDVKHQTLALNMPRINPASEGQPDPALTAVSKSSSQNYRLVVQSRVGLTK